MILLPGLINDKTSPLTHPKSRSPTEKPPPPCSPTVMGDTTRWRCGCVATPPTMMGASCESGGGWWSAKCGGGPAPVADVLGGAVGEAGVYDNRHLRTSFAPGRPSALQASFVCERGIIGSTGHMELRFPNPG